MKAVKYGIKGYRKRARRYYRDQIEILINEYPDRVIKVHDTYVSIQGKSAIYLFYYSGRVKSKSKVTHFDLLDIKKIM